MRITLEELKSSPGQAIDLLEILSLEGQRYMARLHLGGDIKLLSDAGGQTRLFRSSWEVQDCLGSVTIARTEVVHSSAYTQMIGMDTAEFEPLRIKVQGQ